MEQSETTCRYSEHDPSTGQQIVTVQQQCKIWNSQTLLDMTWLWHRGHIWMSCGCGVDVMWLWCGCDVNVTWLWCGCHMDLTWLWSWCDMAVMWMWHGCAAVPGWFQPQSGQGVGRGRIKGWQDLPTQGERQEAKVQGECCFSFWYLVLSVSLALKLMLIRETRQD